jgi:putative ABC transport system permease protein
MKILDLDNLQEIWVTISRNKARSFLTAFGVFWGIFMLMVMLGAGQALQNGMLERIDGFASNSCFIGSDETSIPYKGFQKGRNWNLHNKDADMLLNSVPEIDCLSPMLLTGSSVNNVVFNDYSGSYSIRGVYGNYNEIERQRISFGRFINDIDIRDSRKICVIGVEVYEELFPTKGNPIGKYIRINGIYFQVVGVSNGVSTISVGGLTGQSVFIPFTTMQKINNQGDIIDLIAVTAKPGVSVKEMQEKIKELLKLHNNIAPSDMQAVMSFNLEEIFNMYKYLFWGISIIVWIVGSGTLLAGIVGVSNIMVVTVGERTREIGIRRALGAKPHAIITQIMSETLLLTSIAGISGLCFGVLFQYLSDVLFLQNAENVFMSTPIVSFNTAIVSSIILLIFGLFAGWMPVKRALKIQAIDAIREK